MLTILNYGVLLVGVIVNVGVWVFVGVKLGDNPGVNVGVLVIDGVGGDVVV